VSVLVLAFDINFFTEVLDLNFLLEDLKNDEKLKKFAKFNEALIGIIQDYSLVSFSKLHVEVILNNVCDKFLLSMLSIIACYNPGL